MTNRPDIVLAPDDAYGKPINSIDLLYGPDHERELVDVLRRREQKLIDAGDMVARRASWILSLFEQEAGERPHLRQEIEYRLQEWQEAKRHG